MIRRPCLVLAVLCTTVPAAAQPPSPASTEPLALVNANLVGVRDGKITANATIVLRDGRVARIGTGAAPAGVKVIDLKGKYVLPGLIDLRPRFSQLPSIADRPLPRTVMPTTSRRSGVRSRRV